MFAAAMGLALALLALRGNPAPAAAGISFPVREVRLSLLVPSGGGFESVEITMFALDDGSTPIGQRIAEGRAAMLARFPGAIERDPAEVEAQFKIFGIRWPGRFATWLYNPEGGPPSMPADTALAAIQAGAGGWTNAGGTGWHFDYLSTTSTPAGCNGVPEAVPRDGLNVVGWGHIAGGYLGYSCWWRSSTLVEGTPYFEAIEFDIIFEPLFPYTSPSLRALAHHEFGHALGLDHTEAPCPGQAMCPDEDAMIYTSPQPDDLNGLVALYGLAPAPPSPAPTTAPTATSTVPGLTRRVALPLLARD
ncbi:MAG: hypothetical protein AMXMBFR80_13760 [Dehalococcoidia bacterium]